MKVRLDFVTNSSASSYVCEICGEEDYTWERPDWLTYCVNSHELCEDHVFEFNPDRDSFIDEDGQIAEECCPICMFKCYSQRELAAYLLKTRKVSRDAVFEEIKKNNKRRKKLYDHEYIDFVFRVFELNEAIILDELKCKFRNHRQYSNFIHGTCDASNE